MVCRRGIWSGFRRVAWGKRINASREKRSLIDMQIARLVQFGVNTKNAIPCSSWYVLDNASVRSFC